MTNEKFYDKMVHGLLRMDAETVHMQLITVYYRGMS